MSEAQDAQQAAVLEETAHAHAQAQLHAAQQAHSMAAKAQAHAHAQVLAAPPLPRLPGHVLPGALTSNSLPLAMRSDGPTTPADSSSTGYRSWADRVSGGMLGVPCLQAQAQAQAQTLANQAHNLQAHAQQLQLDVESAAFRAQPQVGPAVCQHAPYLLRRRRSRPSVPWCVHRRQALRERWRPEAASFPRLRLQDADRVARLAAT